MSKHQYADTCQIRLSQWQAHGHEYDRDGPGYHYERRGENRRHVAGPAYRSPGHGGDPLHPGPGLRADIDVL